MWFVWAFIIILCRRTRNLVLTREIDTIVCMAIESQGGPWGCPAEWSFFVIYAKIFIYPAKFHNDLFTFTPSSLTGLPAHATQPGPGEAYPSHRPWSYGYFRLPHECSKTRNLFCCLMNVINRTGKLLLSQGCNCAENLFTLWMW